MKKQININKIKRGYIGLKKTVENGYCVLRDKQNNKITNPLIR